MAATHRKAERLAIACRHPYRHISLTHKCLDCILLLWLERIYPKSPCSNSNCLDYIANITVNLILWLVNIIEWLIIDLCMNLYVDFRMTYSQMTRSLLCQGGVGGRDYHQRWFLVVPLIMNVHCLFNSLLKGVT